MTIEKNNLDIPDYLNEEFFKTSLENGLKTNDIEIVHLNFTMGSSLGDNYSSNIYRVVVTYKEKTDKPQTVSLIIKSIPKDEHRAIMDTLNFHGKEIRMLFDVVPKMEALINTKIAPKGYYSTYEPLNTLVLEDLRVNGFTLADREQGLNEKQCKVVLEKLGKFHATSMKVVEKEPQLIDCFPFGYFTSVSMNTEAMETFFIKSLELETKIVEKWPGYEKYAAKMKNIHKNMKERCLAVTKPIKDEIKVLNHGDLWVNNFMLQYAKDDPENPIDIRFFDFQAPFFISPGIDINYFLNSSVEFEVLKNRRDFMIEEYYYKSYRSTLVKIGYKNIPSLDDIKKEILRKEFYGFVTAVGLLPIICMDKKASVDSTLEAILDEKTAEIKRFAGCSTKRFEKTMKYMLERADSLGVLD